MGWSVRISYPSTGQRLVSSRKRPFRLWGLPSFSFSGYYWAYSLSVKRPGREVDQSPLSGSEVKNKWICISAYLYALTELCVEITPRFLLPFNEDVSSLIVAHYVQNFTKRVGKYIQ